MRTVHNDLLIVFLQSSCKLLLLIVAICTAIVNADPMLERFEQWMGRHGRLYGEAGEKQRRLEVYRRNVELIEAFNSMSSVYKLTDNKFANLTTVEYSNARSPVIFKFRHFSFSVSIIVHLPVLVELRVHVWWLSASLGVAELSPSHLFVQVVRWSARGTPRMAAGSAGHYL
jgi:hypothetical protein